MDFHFANVAIFTAVAAGFVVMNLVLSRLLRPRSTTEPAKLAIYECGEPTIGQAWIRFDIRFYTVALMFVVFDVEVALLFPWGAIFRDLVEQGLGGLAFLEAAVFIVILMVGLAYVWARGDIEWTASPQAAPAAGAPPVAPGAPPSGAAPPVREPALAGDPHGH
jgi:NADH-quinone oxidoreductase subunit A